MKYLLTIMLLWTGISTGLSQIKFSGIVKDRISGEALPGAHVILPSAIDRSTVTNEKGHFLFKNIQAGDTVIISFTGYNEKTIYAKPGPDPLDISLERDEIKLKEVTVKSTVLGAENFTFSKLSPIDIYQNPSSKADPLVAVNTSVSSTTTDENAAVSFRGASPNQTGYFLNGVPVKSPVKYAQLTNTGTLSIFNTDFLKKVTVFPGNPPVEYGQSTSGTIVLEMADRFPKYWQQTASISMANLGYSARGSIGKSSFLGLFANYQFDEALQAVNPSNFENINAFNSIDAGILLSAHHKWGSIKFYQYGLRDNYNFQYRHPSYQDGFLQDAIRSISTLQWIQEFSNLQVTAVLGNSYVSNQFNFGNLNYTEKNNDPYGAIHLTWLDGNHLIKTGYSYWLQSKFQTGQFPEYDYAMAPEHPSFTHSGTNEVAIHEAYSFYRRKWRKHSFGSGFRLGFSPQFSEHLYSYQFNYLWQPISGLQLKAGLGRYYQVGNTENNKHFYSHQSGIDLSYKRAQLAIDQSFYYNFNGTFANIKGSETTFTYNPNSKLQIDQSISLINGNDDDIQWFSRSFISYKPFKGWSFNATYQTFKGNEVDFITSALFNNNLKVFQPEDPTTRKSFNPYANFSLGINKLFQLNEGANGIFFISVTNIFDRKNTLSLNYNYDYSNYTTNLLTRRSIYTGLVLNFISKKN